MHKILVMTIITSTEYKANQGKYIKRAQEGERVIISSHGGYVELKPVSETDKDVKEHLSAKAFLAKSLKAERDMKEGKTLRFNNAVEAQRWMDSL